MSYEGEKDTESKKCGAMCGQDAAYMHVKDGNLVGYYCADCSRRTQSIALSGVETVPIK